jgi:hypothetical protein
VSEKTYLVGGLKMATKAKNKKATAAVKEEQPIKSVEKTTLVKKDENTTGNFFFFDKYQAREFLLDGEFVTCTLYKKFEFTFCTSATIDLQAIKTKIMNQINHVISFMKISDVITYEDKNKLTYGSPNTAFIVMVPFSSRLNLVTDNFHRMIKTLSNENEPVTYRIKSRSTAKIHVNPEIDTGSFFKGFTANSYKLPRIDSEGKVLVNGKTNIKCGAFIDSEIGLSSKEIAMFNRYNLALNKIILFNNKESTRKFNTDYFLDFGNHFRVVIYNLFIEDTLRTETKVITISLKKENVIQTSEQKIAIGCYISKTLDNKNVERFADVFHSAKGESYLAKDMCGDPNSYEMKTFEAEIDTIDDNIISALGTEDDEPVVTEEPKVETAETTTEEKVESVEEKTETVEAAAEEEKPETSETVSE